MDAVLLGSRDRTKLPVLPGAVTSSDGRKENILTVWEGNPLNSYASLITGMRIEDAEIYGKGTVDGHAISEDWWDRSLKYVMPFRPNLVFLNHCQKVSLVSLQFQNSPSWTLHPFFSQNIDILVVSVNNPDDSPNPVCI